MAEGDLIFEYGNLTIDTGDFAVNDDKLKSIWGEDLFNYCYQKSIDLVGSPLYDIMVMAAIGKLHDQNLFVFTKNTTGILGL